MRVERPYENRPIVDFGSCNIQGRVNVHPIDIKDLMMLTNYMISYGYRLGFDFSFILGVDAPAGNQFNVASAGSSKMAWVKEKRRGWQDIAPDEMSEQYLYRCIELVKADKQLADHAREYVDEIG